MGVTGTLVEHFIVRDDLILRFLIFDQLAELSGLGRFAFADDLGLRRKHADDLFFGVGVAFKQTLAGLSSGLAAPGES